LARGADVQRCLEELGKLEYPNFEILLVDNRRNVPEDDPLPELAKDLPWLRVVRESTPGISAARNAGVAHADGDVIAFTDDDVRVDRGWLLALGTRLTCQPELDAVSGLILPAELESPAQVWYERYYGGFSSERTFFPITLSGERNAGLFARSRLVARDEIGAEVQQIAVYGVGAYVAGANMAFRKTALARIGGFDTALGTGTATRGGEDLAAMIAVLWTGGQVGYEPSAVVHHRHRRGYAELLSQLEGNGVGYTAMLTSLVRNDPRHVFGLASQLPLATRHLIAQAASRVRGKQVGKTGDAARGAVYPASLVRHEYLAYVRGPLAYFRSRSTMREFARS
jgi:cellulose synthase/poly-beta-1,6-N-acetylglucosamine synthase-like glycosyltransferase